MYEEQPSINVEAWSHQDINGLELAGDLPFRADFLSENCPLVINKESSLKPDNNINLIQVSDLHRRSFEVVLGQTDQRILWSDEHGNLFTCLNIKGNSVVEPYIYKDSSLPGGVCVYGLQDGYTLGRIIKASNKLREVGIDTEAIVRVIEPKDWFYNGELLETNDFKKALIEHAWSENMVINRKAGSGVMGAFSINELAEASQSISETGFFVTVRAQKINERLQDLDFALFEGKEKTEHFFKRVFEVANLTQRYQKNKNAYYDFKAGDHESIEYFFSHYLPSMIGKNIGRMNKIGLHHKYINAANISILGGIYDLDGVVGPELGFDDENVAEGDRLIDLDNLLHIGNRYRLEATFDSLRDVGFMVEDSQVIYEAFRDNIIKAYIEERCGFEPTFDTLSLATVLAFRYGYKDSPWFNDFYDKLILTLYKSDILQLEDEILSNDVDEAIRSVIELLVEHSLHGELEDGVIIKETLNKDDLATIFMSFKVQDIANIATIYLENDSSNEGSDDESPYIMQTKHVARAKAREKIEATLTDDVIRPIVYKAVEKKHADLIHENNLRSSENVLAPSIDLPERRLIAAGNIATVIDNCSIEQALGALLEVKDLESLEVIFRYPPSSLFPPFFELAPLEIVTDGKVTTIKQDRDLIFSIGPEVYYEPQRISTYKLMRLKDAPSFSESQFLLTTSFPEPQIRNIIKSVIGSKLAVEYSDAIDATIDLPDGSKFPIGKYI